VRARGGVCGRAGGTGRAAAYSRSATARAAAWAARCWEPRSSATASASAASRVSRNDGGEGAVSGQVGERGHEPGGLPQPVPGRGRLRDAAVRGPGRPVVGVGGLPQDTAAECGGGHVQGVRGRPRGVGGSGRVCHHDLSLFAIGMGWAVLIAGPHSTWQDFLGPMIVAGLGMGGTFAPPRSSPRATCSRCGGPWSCPSPWWPWPRRAASLSGTSPAARTVRRRPARTPVRWPGPSARPARPALRARARAVRRGRPHSGRARRGTGTRTRAPGR